MLNECKQKGVSHEQVFFFAFFLCCWLYRYRPSKHKIFVCEGQLKKILEFIFSSDQEKIM